ncbi:MAG: ankyrin repeat domain-containing protein [Acidimicrobiia bacterium]|nr:ankyrin repeat domain-containing protein [Acidimicrobiia bacterium]
MTLPGDGQLAIELLLAVRGGDVDAIRRLLDAHEGLATARIEARGGTRAPLHLVADWPGYFPRGSEIVALLVEAGADVDARTTGRGKGETPLHWAASSDDVDVAEALIDAGADIEAPDGSIGTPLDNAVGYACYHVAHLLLSRGARVERPWQAAALGLLDRLGVLLGDSPDPNAVSQAFWHACAAGQRRAAERLLELGADLNWVPEYAEGTPFDAASNPTTRQQNVIDWLRDRGAQSSRPE